MFFRNRVSHNTILQDVAVASGKDVDGSIEDLQCILSTFLTSAGVDEVTKAVVQKRGSDVQANMFVRGREQRQGVVALLKFVEVSDGRYGAALISVCAAYLRPVLTAPPDWRDESVIVGGHDQAQSESWAFDLTAQCLATSAKTPNLSHRYLLAALWDACASLLNDVATRSASIDKFFILHGILRAFSDARFDLHTPYLHKVHHFLASLLASDTLDALVQLFSSRTEVSFDTISLLKTTFVFMRNFLASLVLKESNSVDLWESLLDDNAVFRSPSLTDDEREIITRIHTLCWDKSWKFAAQEIIVKDSSEADDDIDPLMMVMPEVVKCAIVCALCRKTLWELCMANILKVLSDVEETFGLGDGFENYICGLEGLRIVQTHFSECRPKVLEFVLDFLTKPSHVFVQLAEDTLCPILRQCACEVLSKSLKSANDQSLVKSTSFTLINTMYSVDSAMLASIVMTTESQIIYLNTVHALTTLVCELEDPELAQTAVSTLVRRMDGSSGKYDHSLMERVTDIALTCSISTLEDILAFSLQSERTQVLEAKKEKRAAIARARRILAANQNRSRDYYEVLTTHLLTVFLEASTHYGSSYSEVPDLKDTLQALALVCSHPQFTSARANTPALTQLFRDFWLTCIIIGVNDLSEWMFDDWKPFLRQIASRTPPLLMDKDKRSLEADLQGNSVLTYKLSDEVELRTKAALCIKFLAQTNEIKALSACQGVYLLTVSLLEALRIHTGDFDSVMRYMTDERLYLKGFEKLLRTVGVLTVKEYIRVHEKLKDGFCLLLIANSAHRLDEARGGSMEMLKVLLGKFPYILNTKCPVYLLLDVLQFLYVKDTKTATEDRFRLRVSTYASLWDECDNIAECAEDFKNLCVEWFDLAIARSLSETISILKAYLFETNSDAANLLYEKHSGLATILGVVSKQSDIIHLLLNSQDQQSRFLGEIRGMNLALRLNRNDARFARIKLATLFKEELINSVVLKASQEETESSCNSALFKAATLFVHDPQFIDEDILRLICVTPIEIFTTSVIECATTVWQWLCVARSDIEERLLAHLSQAWEHSITKRAAMYSKTTTTSDPFMKKMSYAPSKKTGKTANEIEPHLVWIKFIMDRLRVSRPASKIKLCLISELVTTALAGDSKMNRTARARETLYELLTLTMHLANKWFSIDKRFTTLLRFRVFRVALQWFEEKPKWGDNPDNDVNTMIKFAEILAEDAKENRSSSDVSLASEEEISSMRTLLILLVDKEISRLRTWYNPLGTFTSKSDNAEQITDWSVMVATAWKTSPRLSLQLHAWFSSAAAIIDVHLSEFVYADTVSILHAPEALSYVIGDGRLNLENEHLRALLYLSPVSPISAISLLAPDTKPHPLALQYAIRVLEFFPAQQVFFYVPQIVQALRYDQLGYVEHYILNTAKSSQLFAHQIIWNMNANMYKDEDSEIPDPLKPVLDRIIGKIVKSLSGADKDFYEREFGFFSQVTSISGKLKPYIRKSKPEKKKKIDEEMRNIKVDPGVYLPSNPESIVIDIDYDSGKPLQSHAKAPFMATFKIKKLKSMERRESLMYESFGDSQRGRARTDGEEVTWQSAIFKVGDDCRQDILALQLISTFRNIFAETGLPLYLFPYRIVATAPGCGVIEVIPKSISRDMMGREKVNDLNDYYINKFGTSHSIEYQKARNNFVESLAAYSVALYLLQLKDRHNGNIMFDDHGHVVHIDFGFILDICPGGINFESSPFKLTTEMIAVMGGDINSKPYKRFSELCVKAYLALRPYADQIIALVSLMADSGLPCFKGEPTIRKLRDRFQLNRTEKSAADFMASRIRASHQNPRTVLYDEFQRRQNGIPY